MELFIPSLGFLLAGVAFAFFVIPQFAPMVLVIGSAIVLAISLYMHYKQFGVMEYERATWHYNLRKYAPYVMIGLLLLGAYGYYALNQGAGEGYLPESVQSIVSPAMPSLSVPTVGGGMNMVMRTASSRIKELMRHGRITLDH